MLVALNSLNESFLNFMEVDNISVQPQQSNEGLALPDSLWEMQVCFHSAKITLSTEMGLQLQYIPLSIKKGLREFEAKEELEKMKKQLSLSFFYVRDNVLLNIFKVSAVKIQKLEKRHNDKILQLNNKQYVYAIIFFIGSIPYEYKNNYSSHEEALAGLDEISASFNEEDFNSLKQINSDLSEEELEMLKDLNKNNKRNLFKKYEEQ